MIVHNFVAPFLDADADVWCCSSLWHPPKLCVLKKLLLTVSTSIFCVVEFDIMNVKYPLSLSFLTIAVPTVPVEKEEQEDVEE